MVQLMLWKIVGKKIKLNSSLQYHFFASPQASKCSLLSKFIWMTAFFLNMIFQKQLKFIIMSSINEPMLRFIFGKVKEKCSQLNGLIFISIWLINLFVLVLPPKMSVSRTSWSRKLRERLLVSNNLFVTWAYC